MRSPNETYQEMTKFVAVKHPLLSGPHCKKPYILNMDLIPLWFLYCGTRTLARKGQKTIHVQQPSSNMKRATAALTLLTAAGDWLPPMIIIKGSPPGKIACKELKNSNCFSIYACQKIA
jgi:hypothetical protein